MVRDFYFSGHMYHKIKKRQLLKINIDTYRKLFWTNTSEQTNIFICKNFI